MADGVDVVDAVEASMTRITNYVADLKDASVALDSTTAAFVSFAASLHCSTSCTLKV
jgi:tetrahydromethanopterin S-methyltransferase subunit H